jgi:mono/diheme cytochrome c family protein
MKRRLFILAGLGVAILVVLFAWSAPTNAEPTRQSNADLIRQGEYIANIASCILCHTPFKTEYNVPPDQLTREQLKVLTYDEHDALDMDRLLAGGRVFDLGPGGQIVSSNLTPDEETGLGSWSDEEIETLMRTGVRPDGSRVHPLMLYTLYGNMAEDDMDALIAYIRSVPAISNEVPRPENVPPAGGPPANPPAEAPDPTDVEARGNYLMTAVLACTACHTPLDETTGAPVMEKYLAGGQPFIADWGWGTVYSANLTPHATGLASWSDDQIKRAMLSGVRKDDRRLVLMPWSDFAHLTADDLNAVIYFLRNSLPAVDNEVPAPALNEGFVEIRPLATAQSTEDDDADSNNSLLLGIIAAIVVLVVGGGIAVRRQRKASK